MAFWNLIGKLGMDTSQWEGGFKRAQSVAVKFGSELKSAIGGYLSFQALKQLATSTIQYASHLNDLATRLGVSTDALQEWNYAAKLTGATADQVADFFEKLAVTRQKALGGDKSAIAQLQLFKISVEDTKKPTEELAKMVAKVFETGKQEDFVKTLREIGGRGAGSLIPLMQAGFSKTAAEAQRLGIILKGETLMAIDDMGDKIDILTLKTHGWVAAIFEGAGALKDMYVAYFKTIKGSFMGEGQIFGPGFMDRLEANWNIEMMERELEEKQRKKRKKAAAEGAGGAKGWNISAVEGAFGSEIFQPGGTKIPLLEFMKKKKATEAFSGIPSAGGMAAGGGFFLGADAALRSVPQKQLDVLESIDKRIETLENFVLDT